jgi:hypothetical protein
MSMQLWLAVADKLIHYNLEKLISFDEQDTNLQVKSGYDGNNSFGLISRT